MSRPKDIMNAEGRREHGVIVSFSTDSGARMTVHQVARNQIEAVRRCVQIADRHADDGRWFVEAISTPQTVYLDVIGRSRGDAGDVRGTFYRERQMLSRIGRLDMLRVPGLVVHDHTEEPGHAWRRLYGRRGRRAQR